MKRLYYFRVEHIPTGYVFYVKSVSILTEKDVEQEIRCHVLLYKRYNYNKDFNIPIKNKILITTISMYTGKNLISQNDADDFVLDVIKNRHRDSLKTKQLRKSNETHKRNT
jgi:hypothetical protein